MKVASTKLTNPEWERLQNKCNNSGVTIAEYLRDLIGKDADIKSTKSEGQLPNVSKDANMEELRQNNSNNILRILRTGSQSVKASESSQMQEISERVKKQGVILQELAAQVNQINNKMNERPKPHVNFHDLNRKIDCHSLNCA
ncbi:MAG: hypothetical protein ACREAW_00740 [Nitrososphaera sp.]